jgi:hypothetical protein
MTINKNWFLILCITWILLALIYALYVATSPGPQWGRNWDLSLESFWRAGMAIFGLWLIHRAFKKGFY